MYLRVIESISIAPFYRFMFVKRRECLATPRRMGRCNCKLTSGVDISCVNETPTPKIRADINRFQARYITVSFTCIIQDRPFNLTSKPKFR